MNNNKLYVGVVTYHRANNYGAVLQAYALCQYLHKLGCNSEIVDYWPNYHAVVYRPLIWDKKAFAKRDILHKLAYIFSMIFCSFKRYVRNRNFNRFRKRFLNIGYKEGMVTYDAAFYGSDTIWNVWKQNDLHQGFDSVFWGDEKVCAQYKFSYAPSMGNVIDTKDTFLHCQKYIKNFASISVRESDLQKKLQEWGWSNITKVVDPTLLLCSEDWNLLLNNKIVSNKYILCYNLENSPVIDSIANQLSKETGLKIISLTGNVKRTFSHYILDTAGPDSFLSLFKGADYILTSSFHGVVFSIIFNKQFCFHSEKETERISSLLDSCNLTDRFVKKDSVSVFHKQIEYDVVNKRFDAMRQESYRYISNCLNMVKDGKNM